MKKVFAIAFLTAALLVACERPSSPDFQVNQEMEIPVFSDLSYRFVGEGSRAIIDTTRTDFRELFSAGDGGLVYFSSEFDFETGDLDNIIPALNVDPQSMDAELGLIEVDDFSSSFESDIGKIQNEPEAVDDQNNRVGTFELEYEAQGSAAFSDVVDQPGVSPGPGDPLPGSDPDQPPTTVIILDDDDLISAEIQQGSMQVEIANDLGFDLSEVEVTLLSDYSEENGTGSPVGTPLLFENLQHGSQDSGSIAFSDGDLLEASLALEVTTEWDDQNMSSDQGELHFRISDQRLRARNAVGNVRQQGLEPEKDDLKVSDPDFDYAVVSDDPEPGSPYELIVTIVNETELPVADSLISGMPVITIFNSDGEQLDGPGRFENESTPGADRLNQDETATAVFDLSGQKLTRDLTYEIDIGTTGGRNLTVDENDLIVITAETTELEFEEVRSAIDPQSDIILEDVKDVDGDFVEAEVEEGQIEVTFINESELPLTIDYLQFYNDQAFRAKNTGAFFDRGSQIGEIEGVEIPPMSEITEIIPLENTGISNRIAYEGTASSQGTAEPATVLSGDVIRTEMEGSVLLTSASSVLRPQEFTKSDASDISDEELLFTSPDHYVEIASGVLVIRDIENQIDLDVDTLIVSFPTIIKDRNGAYDPADSLWIELSGPDRIRRSSDAGAGQPGIRHDLDNYRIYAPDNKIPYHLSAVTEDTRTAAGNDTVRTVESHHAVSSLFEVENLELRRAFGKVTPRTELINEDEGDDGIIDIFNDNEAEITNIEDLEGFSERVSGISVTDPVINLFYDTNIGVEGEVIAAIVGVNEEGEKVFLSGKPGTDREAPPVDDPPALYADGNPIDRSNLISFELEPASGPGEKSRDNVVRFDAGTTNVDEFLSNFPVEVRFIGMVAANPDNKPGFIEDPVIFNTSMGIDIPVSFSTSDGDRATISDTIDADLSDLPDSQDDLSLTEAEFIITYVNGFPFDSEFTFEFLDASDNVITTSRGEPVESLSFTVDGATVNPETRFTERPKDGLTKITVSGEQADYLYRTRKIRLTGDLATSRDDISGEVKVRARDTITLSVNVNISTNLKVN